MVSGGPLFDHGRHQADDARVVRRSRMNRRSLLGRSLALGYRFKFTDVEAALRDVLQSR